MRLDKVAAAAAAPLAKVTSVLPKPEAVKVDLPSLNPARPNRSVVCTSQLLFFQLVHLKTSAVVVKMFKSMLLFRNTRKVFPLQL